MSGSYFLYGSIFDKYGHFWKKRPFFRADMAGLGKYSMGGYGRIGVYRVNEGLGLLLISAKYQIQCDVQLQQSCSSDITCICTCM